MGQALVEFALVAPIFFLLLFGIIEAGRFILYYQTLNNATREGARYAIVHGSNSFCPSGPMPPGQSAPSGCYDGSGARVVQQVRDTAFGVLGASVVVTPTWGLTGNGRDSDVTVRATYTYNTMVPLVPLPAITITAESRLVINN
ncbi:MAG: TadE/TadG family type IV pilus assembly protein [Candidatus Limnocylindrales bacterium]